MGAAMKYRRVRPEPAGGDTKANRLRWFKEGLTKLAAEGFRRVAFPHEIGCALAGGSWSDYEAAIADYGAANPGVEILIVTWGGGGGGGGKRPGSGHCFKCGQPGHWANRCPNK